MAEYSQDRLGAKRDDFYQLLLEAHRGLSDEESHALNARLVLLMANEIGDVPTISRLLQEGARSKPSATDSIEQ